MVLLLNMVKRTKKGHTMDTWISLYEVQCIRYQQNGSCCIQCIATVGKEIKQRVNISQQLVNN